MAYKRRQYDDTEEKQERAKRMRELEAQAQAPESVPSGFKKGGENASTQSQAPQFTSEFKDMPNLFIDGKINPAYDSSAFQDALAGMGIGVQNVKSDNPFAIIGASIGGLAGGLVNKNVKGRMDYNRDVAETIKINEAMEFRTQANIRAEQLALSRQREQRIAESQATNSAIRQQVQDLRDYESKVKFLSSRLETEENPEYRETYAQELSKLTGLPVNPETRGRTSRKIGDFMYNFTKGGGVELVTSSDGTPLRIQDTAEYLKLVKDIQAIEGEEGTTPEEWEKYIEMAKTQINKIPNINRRTYSAQVLNLAREFQKTGGKQGWINIDGVKEMIRGTQPTPFGTSTPAEQNVSPFMQGDTTAPPFADATVTEGQSVSTNNVPQSASELMPQYDPEYPIVVTDTTNKKVYQLKEMKDIDINSITLPEGRMVTTPSGNTYLRKDGKLYLIKK